MKLLAFETATEALSVAVSIDGDVRERFELAPRRHAELALPWAEQLLAEAGLAKSQLDAIAVGRGPGAFTGVRLAIALVQGMALALDRPVVAVSTLAALALRAPLPSEGEARVLAAYHALARRSRPDRDGSMDPEWEARHAAFHFALVSGCGSEWLLRFREILYDQWDRYRRLSIKYAKDDRDFMREHRELMEAALERDADAATYLMNRHITMSTKQLLEAHPGLSA